MVFYELMYSRSDGGIIYMQAFDTVVRHLNCRSILFYEFRCG